MVVKVRSNFGISSPWTRSKIVIGYPKNIHFELHKNMLNQKKSSYKQICLRDFKKSFQNVKIRKNHVVDEIFTPSSGQIFQKKFFPKNSSCKTTNKKKIFGRNFRKKIFKKFFQKKFFLVPYFW